MTWHPDIPEEYRNQIVTGDARELAKRIPDESVDLIFTDPVYDRIDDYRWLAETAARVLKPDSACLAFCGIGYLPQTHQALLAGGLSYRWRLVIKPVWKLEFHGKLLVGSQECLWYEKGRSKLYQSQLDVQMSTVKGQYSVNGSNWGKSPQVLRRLVEAFTPAGAVILDPFAQRLRLSGNCSVRTGSPLAGTFPFRSPQYGQTESLCFTSSPQFRH